MRPSPRHRGRGPTPHGPCRSGARQPQLALQTQPRRPAAWTGVAGRGATCCGTTWRSITTNDWCCPGVVAGAVLALAGRRHHRCAVSVIVRCGRRRRTRAGARRAGRVLPGPRGGLPAPGPGSAGRRGAGPGARGIPADRTRARARLRPRRVDGSTAPPRDRGHRRGRVRRTCSPSARAARAATATGFRSVGLTCLETWAPDRRARREGFLGLWRSHDAAGALRRRSGGRRPWPADSLADGGRAFFADDAHPHARMKLGARPRPAPSNDALLPVVDGTCAPRAR